MKKGKKSKGFTLVEILIVVVILGILAAIVIPQFSDASTQSKYSSCLSSLQTLRSQIQLYKIQHNDTPPALGQDGQDFKEAMTKKGDDGFGPYLQSVPKNPWNNSDTLNASDGSGVGWVYDVATGDIYLGVADITDDALKTKLTDAGAVKQ